MKCKAEDPARHLPTSTRLAFGLGKLGIGGMLVVGWFVIIPLNLHRPFTVGRMEYAMEYTETVAIREDFGLGYKWEGPSVLFARIPENTRCRVHGYEVGKCMEATFSRHCCKLLRPSGNHWLAINVRHTTGENVEAS